MTLIIVLFAILMATNAFKIENHRTRRPTGPPLAPLKPFPCYEDDVEPIAPSDDYEPIAPNDDFEPWAPSDDYEPSAPSDDFEPFAPSDDFFEPFAPSDDFFKPIAPSDDFEPIAPSDDYEEFFPRNLNPGSSWPDTGDAAADECSRTHDKCPQTLGAFESKYGLKNPGIFTRSHCDCDLAFYSCLRSANTSSANVIGYYYFNMIGSLPTGFQCFKEDYPITGCKLYNPDWIWGDRCAEYKFDTSLTKKNQFFDLPRYYS